MGAELNKLQTSLTKQKSDIPAMALVNLGLSLAMSNNPTFLGSLAEAGTAAFTQYAKLKKEYNNSQKDLISANITLLQAKAAREDNNWATAQTLAKESRDAMRSSAAARSAVELEMIKVMADQRTALHKAMYDAMKEQKTDKIKALTLEMDRIRDIIANAKGTSGDVILTALDQASVNTKSLEDYLNSQGIFEINTATYGNLQNYLAHLSSQIGRLSGVPEIGIEIGIPLSEFKNPS